MTYLQCLLEYSVLKTRFYRCKTVHSGSDRHLTKIITMLQSFRIFVLIFSYIVLVIANEGIFSHENSSFNADKTIVLDDSIRNTRDTGQTVDSLPSIWVADLYYKALSNFTIQKNVGSTACQKQTEMYVIHLKNNSYWAVKMYDSWSRYPNGILTGSTHQMGVYNECIDVHRPVQGKYCMASIRLVAATNRTFNLKVKDEYESFDHAWNEILGFIDYQDQYRRNQMNIGICIPESCSAENLEISLQNALDNIFLPHHVQPQVKVEPILCSTEKTIYPYDSGFFVTITIMCSVFVICFLSTLSHLIMITRSKNKEKQSSKAKCIYWFSIIHNGRNLIKYDKNNELNIFNGFKTVVMILVLFGHKFLYYIMTPISYSINLEKILKNGPDIILTCMNLVDPFFYISGFLMYVIIKPQLTKSGNNWTQIPKIVFYKYMRIIPAYAAMMLLTMYFIPYMYIGPFWASKMWPEAEKCKKYWWTNFLAISNFIAVDNQCLVVGWYISCLIQFIVIGTIVIHICVKNQKLGTSVIIMLLCVSLIIPFVLTYSTRSYGIIRVLRSFAEKTSSSYEFEHLYGPFYIRGIPFYVGLLAGVVVEKLKKRQVKLSKLVIYVWTFIITAVCLWVQFYGAIFYKRHRPYYAMEQATYATLSHCTWTAILFWITVCHFTSGYGPIERIFNNRLMTVFGRLSYAVYLVNISVLMTIENRQTTSVSPTNELAIDGWIVGTFRAYVTGLILYLFIEAPFNKIIKTIFFRSKINVTKDCEQEKVNREDVKNGHFQYVSHL